MKRGARLGESGASRGEEGAASRVSGHGRAAEDGAGAEWRQGAVGGHPRCRLSRRRVSVHRLLAANLSSCGTLGGSLTLRVVVFLIYKIEKAMIAYLVKCWENEIK